MKIGESDVSSESKIIGRAEFPVYETVDEAVNHSEYGVGEQKLLDLINAQVKTNAMNILRTARTKGPTKSSLRSEAMNEIIQEISNGEHQNVIGNQDAVTNLINARMAKIEARMKEAAELAGVITDDDDNDD